ncbi:hypothetical protein ACFVUS_25040 [Nocardia sp. NPDC058058]|uniref:hypothetical protein n=1 Tax=Nocardia sp. NPDC058058 TaxID=3346317 RepID=UPI0036DE11E5
MIGDRDDQGMLAELMAQRHAVEILDLVSESGCGTALLVRMVGGSHSELVSALRVIAGYGLLATDDPEEWADPVAIPGSIRLSDKGEVVAEALSPSRTHRTPHVRSWRSGRDLMLRGFARHATGSPTAPVPG